MRSRHCWNALLACCSLIVGAAAAKDPPRPNVLFIISDDLSAEALGCYGNTQCKTPHLDALAARGVKFTRAYCQFPVCGPSRAALMSGRYPQSIGVMGNGSSDNFTKMIGDQPSMSQLFKGHGYYAARVSKIYHMRVPGDITAGVDGPDHAASWTERFNCQAPEWMTKGEHEHLSNERLRRDPDKHYSLGFGGAFYVVKGESDGAEQPDVLAADKAIEIIKTKGKQGHFFLAVGMVRPHVPLVAPTPYYEPYPATEMKLAKRIENDWADIPKAGMGKTSGLVDKFDKQRRVLSAYYASVAFMDAQVGRILQQLEDSGLAGNTVVVFCSDHGYHLGEHQFWQKLSLHEESTRIPLIMAVPGRKPGVTDSLAQQIDIYPTLADIAKLPIPKQVQGKSLLPVIAAPKQQVHDAIYCTKGKSSHLVRTADWAYLQYANGAELYDMRSDPRQFTNLVDSAKHGEQLKEMRRLLAELMPK